MGELRQRGPFRAPVYNTLIMLNGRGFFCVSACLLAAAVLVPAVSQAQSARPLNHGDYDGWRSIVGQRLSADGRFLAYGLFPQEGDGEVVIRNLATGKEQREPAGQRPAPTPPPPDLEGPPPEARGATITFSADSKTVVFSTFPAKAESEKAKKDKKPAPKEGMVIVDLASGKATRLARVKRFAMAEKSSGFVVYLMEPPDAPLLRLVRPLATGWVAESGDEHLDDEVWHYPELSKGRNRRSVEIHVSTVLQYVAAEASVPVSIIQKRDDPRPFLF